MKINRDKAFNILNLCLENKDIFKKIKIEGSGGFLIKDENILDLYQAGECFSSTFKTNFGLYMFLGGSIKQNENGYVIFQKYPEYASKVDEISLDDILVTLPKDAFNFFIFNLDIFS